MFEIFNYVGWAFGYVLYVLFFIFKNFGISIFFFTILTRLLMFPTSVKQQKSMAANSRLQAKQRELKEKYANNKAKYNEEVQKLYEKEGASPFGGCATSLVPMFIMLGIYYTVIRPLTNVLHLSSDVIAKLNQIPGVAISNTNYYSQINALKMFTHPEAVDMLVNHGISKADANSIHTLAGGFNLFGLDLLSVPSTADGFQLFGFLNVSWILIIPALVLITSLGSQILTMKMQTNNAMNQQQGCMRYMLLLLPLLTVYISYIVPGAVGFYWICSTVIGFVQTVIINKYYSPANLTAKAEAQHVALMEIKEASVPYSPTYVSEPVTEKKKKK